MRTEEELQTKVIHKFYASANIFSNKSGRKRLAKHKTLTGSEKYM
jgi:hypothetical protein